MMRKVIDQPLSPAITILRLPQVAALCAATLLGACTLTETLREESGQRSAVEPTLLISAAAAEASMDYEGAANHYRNLLSRNPGDTDLMLALARNLRYAGQVDQAIALLTPVATAAQAPAPVLLELGKAHLATDHLNLALRFLGAARDAAPHDWEVHSAIGIAQDYQHDHHAAQRSYLEALTLMPDNPVVLNNLGLSQALSGDLPGAIITLRRAADQPGAAAQVRQNLALMLALDGDVEGAERLARMDLPRDMVRENVNYFRALATGVR